MQISLETEFSHEPADLESDPIWRRLSFDFPNHIPYAERLTKLGMLSLSQRRTISSIKLTHKMLKEHDYLSSLRPELVNRIHRPLKTLRNAHVFEIESYLSNFSQRRPLQTGMILFNLLSRLRIIDQDQSTDTIIKKLKERYAANNASQDRQLRND